MPRSVTRFLAPVFFEKKHGSTGHRMGPGLTSSMPAVKPPGSRYLYPKIQMVEHISEPDSDVPESWDLFTVAVVPDHKVERTAIYAVLTMRGDISITGPDYVAFVTEDPNAPKDWERVILARIPDEFWNDFGDAYQSPGLGEFYPADYRVTAEVTGAGKNKAPKAWVQYRPKLGRPYPPQSSEDIKVVK